MEKVLEFIGLQPKASKEVDKFMHYFQGYSIIIAVITIIFTMLYITKISIQLLLE